MNRDIRIFNKKRLNRSKKANTKKPEQVGLCRFIDFKDIQHPKVNGHYTHHPIFTNRRGLQIEHNFYYVINDEIVCAKINKRGAKVLNVYNGTPTWASPKLIEKQEKFLQKNSKCQIINKE